MLSHCSKSKFGRSHEPMYVKLRLLIVALEPFVVDVASLR